MGRTRSLRAKSAPSGMKRRRPPRVRLVVGCLLGVALVGFQYRLWFGDGSIAEVVELRTAIEAQRDENERLTARNRELAAEVADLKSGLESIEHRARRDLGMTRQDETFYQIVERR